MEYTKFSGKTVNDAIIDACQKLEVTSDKLEYEVVEEGSSGFLGFNAKPAIINARVKEEEAKPDQKAKDFLNDVFASMKLTVVITADYNEDDNSLSIDLAGDDMGILIGKRGQTLDSLQYLVSLVVNKGQEEYIRVKVDTENYRQRRKETLENLAKNIAFKVKRTKRPVSLEPMNPYERRIIHSALQNESVVATIVRRNRHDRSRTVAGQYIVADPDGNRLARKRVNSVGTTEYTGYLAVGDALALGTFLGTI